VEESSEVETTPLISSIEEVLISDKLASKLRIAVEDPAEGLWRLRSDTIDKLRRSSSPQKWR